MSLPSGTQIGPYRIVALLGAGGMGEVYRARDDRLGRDIALKILPREVAGNADRLHRFEREARAASALTHPGIVTVYDIGAVPLDGSGAQPYIAMELIEGRTLRALLHEGPLTVREALHIASQLADGLAKAHDAGIVHRDLKPDNVIVSTEGFAKILDFGLAKLAPRMEPDGVTRTHPAPPTQPGWIMGTVGYMAPEQARGDETGPASDQFALGLMLYEMLTGRRAFERATSIETLAALMNDDPEPVERLRPGVPAPVRWIVERCVAKNPAERYASTRDLARDLAQARDRLSEIRIEEGTRRISGGVGQRERIGWAAALLAVIGLAAALNPLSLAPREAASPARGVTRFTVAPPENSFVYAPGVAGSPVAVSPDGQSIVFIGQARGRPRTLWVRRLDEVEARPLAGTEGALLPFWSPDSRWIGFFSIGGTTAPNRLMRIAIDGSPPEAICDANAWAGAAWSPDGFIVFSRAHEAGFERVPASGGVPVTVFEPEQGETLAWPVFLPDGKHFIFHQLGAADTSGIHVASIDGTVRKRLIPSQGVGEFSTLAFAPPDYLLYARDRVLLAQRVDLDTLETTGEPVQVATDVETFGPAAAFGVSQTGVLAYWPGNVVNTQLTWVDRQGTVLGTVGPPGSYIHIALDRDGHRVALNGSGRSAGIWLLDVARGSLQSVKRGTNLFSPVWSPGGQAVAFAAVLDSPPNVYLQDLDGPAKMRRLTQSTIQQFPLDWSSAGLLYLENHPDTRADLWLLPMPGDEPVPLVTGPAGESIARVSPDGRWLAYTSNESERNEIYVTPFPKPGRRWLISLGGGSDPAWSHDGRELFYVAPDDRLMVVGIDDGSGFDHGPPRALFELNARRAMSAGAGWGYAVAADGRLLVNRVVEEHTTPITVVLDWQPGVF